jgi:phosphoribosylformylglycinamidine synthase
MGVKRIFVEKKDGFNNEALNLLNEFKTYLRIKNIKELKILHRYDVEGIDDNTFEQAAKIVFSEAPVDRYFIKDHPYNDWFEFAVEYHPGQYDQRADSAAQCIQILTQKEQPVVRYAKVYLMKGDLSKEDIDKIKKYTINETDSQEARKDIPETLEVRIEVPDEIEILDNFINLSEKELKEYLVTYELAMSYEDLLFCQEYFKYIEKRNPTITEIRILDTYWSDHCRHTTFLTEIVEVEFSIKDEVGKKIKDVFYEYLNLREKLGITKPICLMDIATIAAKGLKKAGKLKDLDESDEINACSIKIKVKTDQGEDDWLLMFKNETHNHPTEIEPFGGAATCLGGAIRDPLSGRSYVYQAMRVTGSGDPTQPFQKTLPGKLPQRKITIGAAHGYSSYGNQIGLATGLVKEIYHPGYIAKRMEIGAVIGAAPIENVRREKPVKGDVVILVGGRTGRDGCGGATGSSKAHNEKSIEKAGAEVQKGNPPIERKLQRLFRNPEATLLIKKCNDFGAGGVSVAIGELADGVDINLDAVPKKYEGLDGTELAISESQERMAVVVDKKDAQKFIDLAKMENLEATIVAEVTDLNRMRMFWKNSKIVDISRDFLNSNGAPRETKVKVLKQNIKLNKKYYISLKEELYKKLKDLNSCSQKGLVERFDSSIGQGTVLIPFGGKYQLTPSQVMVAKIPVLYKDTSTVSLMSYGFDPYLTEQSPFIGAIYAIIESIAKLVAAGCDYKKVYLSLQEYFERLGNDPAKWGKPFSALLGAFYVQMNLGIAAIGGKDSMSGTYNDLNVPPTLVSFAVSTTDLKNVISNELKEYDSKIVAIQIKFENNLPDFDNIKYVFDKINKFIKNKNIKSAYFVSQESIAEALSKMSFGNRIGIEIDKGLELDFLLNKNYNTFLCEVNSSFFDEEFIYIGKCIKYEEIRYRNEIIKINEAIDEWLKKLDDVFPIHSRNNEKYKNAKIEPILYKNTKKVKSNVKIAKPRVFIPVFPGTNCEYDTTKAFIEAGAIAETFVFKNLTSSDIRESIEEMAKIIYNSQIIAIPGGFSAGDEPEGSGKFIATIFRNPLLVDAVMDLLKKRDGLMLGICNGFQALIKLGLVPYGEIRELNEESPTLTYNNIGRHISKIVPTKVVSNLSPWLSLARFDQIYNVPVSHGEGKFYGKDKVVKELIKNGQIATQYVDFNGNPTMDEEFNPNGSVYAVEGITSPDGRVFGKMGHTERVGKGLYKNFTTINDIRIFEAGVKYFL